MPKRSKRPKNYFPSPPRGSLAERILAADPPPGPLVYLDRRQVCERENCSDTALRDKVKRGDIPAGLSFSPDGHIRKWFEHWFTVRDRFVLEDARKRRRSA